MEHGLRNRFEDKRYSERVAEVADQCADLGYLLPTLVTVLSSGRPAVPPACGGLLAGWNGL